MEYQTPITAPAGAEVRRLIAIRTDPSPHPGRGRLQHPSTTGSVRLRRTPPVATARRPYGANRRSAKTVTHLLTVLRLADPRSTSPTCTDKLDVCHRGDRAGMAFLLSEEHKALSEKI